MRVIITSSEVIPGYVRKELLEAFSRIGEGIHIPTIQKKRLQYIDLDKVNEIQPDLLIFGDLGPIPVNLSEVDVLTACFQFDTYAITRSRILQSSLFDLTFVFHPQFVDQFKKAGLINTIFIPYAIDPEKIKAIHPYPTKFEVGFVGDIKRKQYSIRRDYIISIKDHYRHNNFEKYYTWEEMISIYKSSELVVNVPRNDYLIDANLRCVEAMASGSLLLTLCPTELSELGFVENEHYVSFKNKSDLKDKINYFLRNPMEREKIALSGQNKTISEFNYDIVARRIISACNGVTKRKIAPDFADRTLLRIQSRHGSFPETANYFLRYISTNPSRLFSHSHYLIKPFIKTLLGR